MVEQPNVADKAKALLVERRLLFFCTCLVGAATLIWVIAVNTQGWFTVAAQDQSYGIFINETQRFFLRSRSGLFRICRVGKKNQTAKPIEICRSHEMFPSDDKIRTDPSLDRTILNYTRTEMFFSVVSVLLMLMGFLFSIYTFRNPRYMFKRLAAGVHFLSCASVIVVLEVVINSIYYEKAHLPFVHPRRAVYYYGYSFYLGWLVFAFNAVASIAFLVYSKKRKGDKALTEEMAMADEPTIIGR
ncbi:voltage-dependent calcium channel gamma-2 subunit [Cimex lectularius]|uniref:Uncharacterized protein n=1 Tax=Cimex lectularius TaxID=79782 RepID=A0A8I6S7P8_CIMLE|nr:voltage-dependent calcium channel gamma-2 subunit [Cimex lectularius]